jgi:cytochrome P450
MDPFAAFHPESAAFYQGDADAVFRRLRAEDPVHWYEPSRFWAITRFADVQNVSQRPRLF